MGQACVSSPAARRASRASGPGTIENDGCAREMHPFLVMMLMVVMVILTTMMVIRTASLVV